MFQNFQLSIYNHEKTIRYSWCSADQRNCLKFFCKLKRNQDDEQISLFFPKEFSPLVSVFSVTPRIGQFSVNSQKDNDWVAKVKENWILSNPKQYLVSITITKKWFLLVHIPSIKDTSSIAMLNMARVWYPYVISQVGWRFLVQS